MCWSLITKTHLTQLLGPSSIPPKGVFGAIIAVIALAFAVALVVCYYMWINCSVPSTLLSYIKEVAYFHLARNKSERVVVTCLSRLCCLDFNPQVYALHFYSAQLFYKVAQFFERLGWHEFASRSKGWNYKLISISHVFCWAWWHKTVISAFWETCSRRIANSSPTWKIINSMRLCLKQ